MLIFAPRSVKFIARIVLAKKLSEMKKRESRPVSTFLSGGKSGHVGTVKRTVPAFNAREELALVYVAEQARLAQARAANDNNPPIDNGLYSQTFDFLGALAPDNNPPIDHRRRSEIGAFCMVIDGQFLMVSSRREDR